MNLVLAFLLLFLFFAAIGPESGTTRVGTIEKGFPAANVLEPGDRIVSVEGCDPMWSRMPPRTAPENPL